ncbi:MAG: winged helix-turn-helix domain-containing protein, partial [Kangiellaceae bacterium]|nr:winged helix-turn-helix domain-containing protein [Kangiellaceae bacterium]MCW8998473.1 winged helix-turn-helix domain-containing protein [Kangiellaceae bacterium]
MLQSADLIIDLTTRQVFKSGQALQLHSLTFDLLAHLIQIAPQTASSEELLTKVWGEQQVSPETLTQRIALLRRALGETKEHKYIQSVRGKGYRWCKPASELTRFQANKNKLALSLSLLIILLVSYFIWFDKARISEDIKAGSDQFDLDASDELVKQAWNYYRRFDLKNNLIAIDLFTQRLKVEPNDVNALIGLSAAYSQQTTKFNQDHKVLIKGRELAEQAIKLVPENAEAWWALGFNLDAQGKIEAAMDAYRRAIAIDPNDLSVKASLAYLLAVDGNLTEALKLNLESFKSNAHFRHTQVAQILSILGYSEVAESWHRKATALNPDSIFAAVAYAQFLFNEGRLSEAKQLVKDALDNGIKRTELLILLSQIQLLENDLTASQVSIQQAEKIAPFNSEVKVWKLWLKSLNQKSEEQVFISLWDEYTAEVGSEDYWPNNLISLAMLSMVKKEHEQAADYVFRSFQRGFRDAAWLKQTPVFKELALQPKFIQAIETMQTENKRQRKLILDAEWLPQDFLNPKKY